MNKPLQLLALIILALGAALPVRGQDSLLYIVTDTLPVEQTIGLKPDTVPTPFEPELESVLFVPKGQWVTGVSINWTQSTQNRYQFLVLEDLSGDTYSFKVSPMLIYIVRNDLGLGG